MFDVLRSTRLILPPRMTFEPGRSPFDVRALLKTAERITFERGRHTFSNRASRSTNIESHSVLPGSCSGSPNRQSLSPHLVLAPPNRVLVPRILFELVRIAFERVRTCLSLSAACTAYFVFCSLRNAICREPVSKHSREGKETPMRKEFRWRSAKRRGKGFAPLAV